MNPVDRLARLEEIERRKTSYGQAERIAALTGIAVGDLMAEAERLTRLAEESGRTVYDVMSDETGMTIDEIKQEAEAFL